MTSEFSTIVCCYRLDMLLEWREQMYDSTCQLFGILSLCKFSHKQHICTAFYQCYDSTVVPSSYNGVHLEVPKTLSVSFSRSLTDACSIGYENAFATDRSGTMLQPVTAAFIQCASFSLVLPYHTVYCLMANILAILGQCARDLLWRPLLSNKKTFRFFLDGIIHRMIARLLTFCTYCIGLGCLPVIAPSNPTIASYFTRHSAWIYIYRLCDVFLFHSILE